MRVERPLFFASGYHLRNILSRLAGHRCLVLDLQQVPFLDVTGAELLEEAVGLLRHRGMRVVLAQPAASVARRLRDLSRSESSALRACPVSPSIQDAMLHAAAELGRDDLCDRRRAPGRCAGVERAVQETGALDLAATAIGAGGVP